MKFHFDTDFKVGLKIKHVNYSWEAEVMGFDIRENVIRVMICPSDGHCWNEEWDYKCTKWGFERGEYFIPPPDVSVGI